MAVDVQVAVRAERQPRRFLEVVGGKNIQELSGLDVKAQNLVGAVTGDVEVAVGADGQAARIHQVVVHGEGAQESASLFVITEDLMRAVAGNEPGQAQAT